MGNSALAPCRHDAMLEVVEGCGMLVLGECISASLRGKVSPCRSEGQVSSLAMSSVGTSGVHQWLDLTILGLFSSLMVCHGGDGSAAGQDGLSGLCQPLCFDGSTSCQDAAGLGTAVERLACTKKSHILLVAPLPVPPPGALTALAQVPPSALGHQHGLVDDI